MAPLTFRSVRTTESCWFIPTINSKRQEDHLASPRPGPGLCLALGHHRPWSCETCWRCWTSCSPWLLTSCLVNLTADGLILCSSDSITYQTLFYHNELSLHLPAPSVLVSLFPVLISHVPLTEQTESWLLTYLIIKLLRFSSDFL